MKTFNSRLAGVLSASALAIGLIAIAQPALAGISATRHNLGSNGPNATAAHLATGNSTGNGTGISTEICVFCHTPHGSNTSVTAPLWNKYINPATSYLNYTSGNSATFDAEVFGPGNVSLACLSCHDGTQAMDNIINEAGSAANATGLYDTNGSGTRATASGRAYTWNGARVSAEGVLGGGATTGIVAMLGTDLVNDHPIGINYCAAATAGAVCGDADFIAMNTNAAGKRFIDTGTLDAVFQKSDLPLYGATATTNSRIECATCHDPHVSNTETFLRTKNDGSTVCLACHNK